MSTREGDARTEVAEFEETIAPVVYRDGYGNVVENFDPDDPRWLNNQILPTTISAPVLTAEEQTQAATALREMLEAGTFRYPALANSLLQDPSKLWLMGEIQMMLSPEPNEVSYDYTSDLTEALTSTTGQRTEYEYRTVHQETQQLFWNEIGSQYSQADREVILDALAQLTPEGADTVGANALAWLDTHGLDDEEMKHQMLINILNQAAGQQDYELGETGFFGAIDALQEGVEREIISPLINAGVGLLGGADEAARRRGLTPGQQVMYTFGVKPPENAGDFGWWKFGTGAVDALVEIGGDPLSWVAGLGAGAKAIKTIPIAQKATKAGRAAAALRALLPKPLAGVGKAAPGGRFARVTYALGAKPMDELMAMTIKHGVAGDAMDLVKAGNMSKFQRLYPAWSGMSDEAVRTIQEAVESPEEFIEVLKSDALNELIRGGRQLDEVTAAAHRSEEAMRGYAPSSSIADEIAASSDDFVFMGRQGLTDSEAADLLAGRAVVTDGGLAHKLDRAKGFATRTGSDSGTRAADTDLPGKIMVFRKSDLPEPMQRYLAEVKGEGKLTDIEQLRDLFPDSALNPVHIFNADEGIEAGVKAPFKDLLMDQRIPRDLRLQAAKDRLAANALNTQTGRTFLLSEVPQRSKRIFSWQKVLDNVDSPNRVATSVRRTVARITPGRIPDNIELFNTRQGIDDLRRLGEHFGLRQGVIDDLVGEFEGLEMGARQDWVWDTFLRRLGRETGVPAFEHQLVQFYKSAGVRNYSASGADLLPDGSRIPMLPTQMVNSMPVPVDVMGQVFNRARSIGTRSKLAKAMGFNGRGLGKTKDRRMDLVKRLRRDLGDQAADMSDDQLYDMAYSLVSPNAGLDARGIWAGKILPKAGTWADNLHTWFTKSMLVFRPIQWMWRVALLEEPLRAHMFNLPSLYSNPLQYMARAREAHYIWNVRKWAEANMSWGQDILHVLTRGGKDDMLARVTDAGLMDEVFAGVDDLSKLTVTQVRRGIENYVGNAVYGRTRPDRLNPVKRVPWAVKNRAHSISVAEKKLAKLGAPSDFDVDEAAQEIVGRLVSGYLGEAVGSTYRKLYQWSPGMAHDEAFTHGRVWGTKMVEFVEDPFGRAGLRRYAAILRGETPDITGHNLVNSSRWPHMAPDLRTKYSGVGDDIAVAEAYLDDMLKTEIEHLFKPFADELSPNELADLLDEFATTRKISTSIGGEDIEWDLRSANYGGGVRSVGDFTASVRHDVNLNIPSDLPAVSLDGRFMAEDDPGIPARMANWVLQTFGEKATQTINRRPAWIHEYDRWYKNYRNLDIPEEHAVKLATDHANKMVNHVFFNMDEAPYYVSKLNKVLPFFGATYEVVGTWSYKMPVAVGGSWPAGVGEFARKFDRLIDGLVNMGLLTREQEQDGTTSLTLNLVPPSSDAASTEEAGRFLSGAGFKIVNTLDQAISTILNLEEGLGLRSQGYRLAAGHPLNPSDYGILSFAQADVGFNPATNILVSALAGRIPGATGPRLEAVAAGESVADVAQRLNVDVDTLLRYNREVFIDTDDFGSSELYNGLLGGNISPEEVIMPQSALNLPGSSLWDALSDTFMPFGEITSPHEFGVNFIPGAFRWVMAGLALQNQPSDEFWASNDLGGMFGGVLPSVNQAQAASQLNEAFMYLEAHDLVNGKGPLTRILEKEAVVAQALEVGDTEKANALQAELRLDVEAFLGRANKVAAESLIMRGLTGQMLPTTPGHVRLEQEKIREFWDTREYADSIRAGDGTTRLRNFKSIEDVEQYQEQLASWLNDPTGDRARAVFRANNPQLMAYLTPKTFYKNPVPDIQSYEEYQRQIESGEREPSPLHVTMWRARSAAIQADYYNEYIASFGNDPVEAAATALQNRTMYQALQDKKDLDYQALEMWDDMHGGVYDNWRTENYEDVETWAQDQINDKLHTVRDNLQILFELEDNLDIELDLEGVANLNSSIRGAVAEIGNAIRAYEGLTEQVGRRNAYEDAIDKYFKDVYIPYVESLSDLYDKLPEVADTERQSLIYEQIKFIKNQHAGSMVYLDGNTAFPFPNPLEYSWQGKSKEEREVKMQQWVTRPVLWMDKDQAQRILEVSPQMQGYLPSEDSDFTIYREYTLKKIEIDEAFENDEITRSQRNEAISRMDERLHTHLIEQGRGREVQIMQMTPWEKLELSGLLPPIMGIFGDHVRYYKQVLEVNEESAGTVKGRQVWAPLYNMVEQAFYGDPDMREAIQKLGINLQDETALDALLPWLFFGYSGER